MNMKKNIFLLLATIGLIVAYLYFIPFLLKNGLNLSLIGAQMFQSHISSFFTWDVIISGMALLALIIFDAKRKKTHLWWLSIVGLFTVGVSFALPLYLYLREK